MTSFSQRLRLQNFQDPFLRVAILTSLLSAGFVLSERMAQSPRLAFAILVAAIAAAFWRIQVMLSEKRDLPINAVDPARLAKLSVAQNAAWIKAQLRGHDEAVDRVCDLIERGLRLSDLHHPLGACLLVGPTGTGKTYLAELISHALFGENRLITFSLNHYKNASDGELLIEQLLEPVCEDPHRVILLDEIDKANPHVLHALYEILDRGRCRSLSSDRVVSFAGCVIFATSNSGVEGLRALRERLSEGKSPGSRAAAWIGGARDALASEAEMDPAFLARWDDVLLMDELPSLRTAEVACLSIARHWERHGLRVWFATPQLVASLVRENREFSRYGVRQLQQLIRARSDRAILMAREKGFNVLYLGLGPSGEFVLLKAGRG